MSEAVQFYFSASTYRKNIICTLLYYRGRIFGPTIEWRRLRGQPNIHIHIDVQQKKNWARAKNLIVLFSILDQIYVYA